MIIREARLEDLRSILDIMNEAILNTTSIYDYAVRSPGYIENWFSKKQQDQMPVIVAETDGHTVGYGSYGIFRAWDAYRFSVEHSVYVHPQYQGNGIGKKILMELISRAKTGGYHTMIAGIDAANKPSYALHQQLGFVEAGRFNEVGYKFEKWLDLVFMQLLLKK